MSRHALSEKRPFLLASIAAAVAYFFLRDAELPEILAVAVKGAAVALLAAYAWQRHSSSDARSIAWVMAIGALGDIAVEYSQEIGGLLFFLGHLIAIALYWRHRREALTPSQKAAVVVLLLLTPAIAWLLPEDRTAAQGVALYALALGGMAASAWASSFSRYRVGVGALLFVASDLLIFAEMGPLSQSPIPHWTIWPAYYCGQFLICVGVLQSLRKRDPELRLVSSN
ncbi:MAG: lysoplasmalogenase [Novosphingobium sp.]|nr:lysoplasmalogenase [Novosphingobium sp.]